MRREGAALRVDYAVENRGERAVWLLDQPLVFGPTVGVRLAPDRVVVRAGEAAVARLIRGYAPPLSLPQVELPPAARPLAPGERASGHAVVPLPLAAWHPNDRTPRPLPEARSLVLEVGYLDSDADLAERPLDDGTEVWAPSPAVTGARQRLLRGDPRPLP